MIFFISQLTRPSNFLGKLSRQIATSSKHDTVEIGYTASAARQTSKTETKQCKSGTALYFVLVESMVYRT